MTHVPVREAIRQGGGISKVAHALGIKPPSISRWITVDRIPALRVLEVERITKIPRHELRPDIYPEPFGHVIAGNFTPPNVMDTDSLLRGEG